MRGFISTTITIAALSATSAFAANMKCTTEILGGNCPDRCKNMSAEIAPTNAKSAVGSAMPLNFILHNSAGSGDAVENSGAGVSWGDGTPDTPISPVNSDSYSIPHTYGTAGDYTVSFHFGKQFKYDGNGSCSYRCNSCATSTVHIH